MPRRPNRPATIATAAVYAPCGRRTLQRYIQQGKLPAWRFGSKMVRVDLGDVDGLFRVIPTAGNGAA